MAAANKNTLRSEERALKTLIKRATRRKDWSFVQLLLFDLGKLYEEQAAEKAALPAEQSTEGTSTHAKA